MLEPAKLMRRVAGYHDIRMDGIGDLVLRARGATVLDVGCNRGLVGFEFANNGAMFVHGCDNYEDGIRTARELFIDLRSVQSQFEVVDLTRGPIVFKVFGDAPYDIVLMLATVHKLARIMSVDAVAELIRHLGNLTHHYLGWRSTERDHEANEAEMKLMDDSLRLVGLRRIHTSYISDLGPAAIWAKS